MQTVYVDKLIKEVFERVPVAVARAETMRLWLTKKGRMCALGPPLTREL